MSERAVAINRQTLHRFVRIVKGFLSSEVGGGAFGLFALLIGLLFAMSGLNVVDTDGAWAWRWTEADPVPDRGDEFH